MWHAILTIIFCGVAWLLGCPAWTSLLPAAFYFGRELAQAEYRYIEDYCDSREDMPLLVWFYPAAWTVKGLLDWLLPVVVSALWFACLRG